MLCVSVSVAETEPESKRQVHKIRVAEAAQAERITQRAHRN